MNKIFNEAYRPKDFCTVIGLDSEIESLVNQDMPHLLFIGPAGTGKTTTAKIIIDKLDADVLLLNASKDRGIDTIREKIEPFAAKASSKIKIVFLDEFDATTPQFQTALRNFMETYSSTTRFIATCNYPNKIIAPLISRFSQFNFSGYKRDDIVQRLHEIIQMEGIKVDDGCLEIIAKKYKDDIRGMINFLNKNKNKEIKKEDISFEKTVLHILSMLKEKKWFELRQELLNETLVYEQIINEIDETVFKSPLDIEMKRKVNIICAQGLLELKSFDGEIIFASVLGRIQEVL